MVSAPAPPSRLSFPAPPSSLLDALFPVSALFSALPVPLMAALPVSTRFSRLTPSAQLRLPRTVSMPSLAFSVTTSDALSTRKRSSPAPPSKESAPVPPSRVSLPAPPSRVLASPLPVSTLFSALPVPLIDAPPVRVRFSRLAPKVQLRLLRTVSVPSLAFSAARSDALSTR